VCADANDPNNQFELVRRPGDDFLPTTGDFVTVSGVSPPANPRAIEVTEWKEHVPAEGRRNVGGTDENGRRLREAGKTGTRTAAALVIRFTDANGNVIGMSDAARDTLKSDVTYMLFTDQKEMWETCSYNQITLAGDGTDVFHADVPQKCTSELVQSSTSPCTQTYDLSLACGTAEYYGFPRAAWKALEGVAAKSSYQHSVVVFDKAGGGSKCNWYAMGNVGCSGTNCYSWIPNTNANKIISYFHELGHNIHLVRCFSNIRIFSLISF